MIDLAIPGFRQLRLSDVVLDYNGTLAVNGSLPVAVKAHLVELSRQLTIHVVTGDTYGGAGEQLRDAPCRVVVLEATGQAAAKRDYVRRVGPDQVVAIGNGRNDVLMLRMAALAIAVMGAEGTARGALAAADITVHDIQDAIGMLLHPQRLAATLRS